MARPGAEERLLALYRRVPAVACRQLCQEACGPIAMSRLERLRIVKRAGRAPAACPATATCNMLDAATGRCTVYDLRPMICRLYGAIQKLRCPHGCVPARWVDDAEARELIEEVRAVGGGDAPLDPWLARHGITLKGGNS